MHLIETMTAKAPVVLSSSIKSDQRSVGISRMSDDAMSGAFAGFVSRMLTAPFDVVKIRLQLAKSNTALPSVSLFQSFQGIVCEEGWLALWKGNLSATFLWVTYAVVQFGLYGSAKNRIEEYIRQENEAKGKKQSQWKRAVYMFVAGAGAGTTATVIAYPFDIMRTQFALQGKTKIHASIPSYIIHTWTHYGWRGFYSGIGPAVVGVTPYIGLNFAIYETLKKLSEDFDQKLDDEESKLGHAAKSRSKLIGLLKTGLFGGISGGCSKFLVYPMDTVKKRLQAQTLQTDLANVVTKNPLYTGMGQCFATIYRQEGIAGFYKGIIPTIAKAVSSAGITFMGYEGAKMMLRSSRKEIQ